MAYVESNELLVALEIPTASELPSNELVAVAFPEGFFGSFSWR
jgi:hypothetical protein